MNLRETYIAAAIANAREAGEPVTVETLRGYLPSDFDLLPSELEPPAGTLAAIEATDADPAPAFDADFCEAPAPASKMAPRPSPQAAEAANDALIAAHEALAQARVHVQVCQRREAEKNAALARAIGSFQAGFEPYTPADLIRDHLKNEHRLREQAAAGEIAPAQNAPTLSRIDAQRKWARGSGPDAGLGNPGHSLVEGKRVYPAHMRGHRVPVGR